MLTVTIVIIRNPLNKLQFQSGQQAIKILNIEQYILINQIINKYYLKKYSNIIQSNPSITSYK